MLGHCRVLQQRVKHRRHGWAHYFSNSVNGKKGLKGLHPFVVMAQNEQL